MPLVTELRVLKDMATRIRIHSVESTFVAGSGHPTTSSSCAEILSVLFFNTMRYNPQVPKDPASDRFVLSKGHASPALYSVWTENGLVSVDELRKLRRICSDLEGHPTPRLCFIDVATGSLGQGLAIADGMAYAGKYIDKADYRVYCLTGDGESAEGSMWESVAFASFYKLDNLVLIIDVNRLGQSQQTMLGHDVDVYKNRLDAFGFNTIIVDGHNINELVDAFDSALCIKDKPTAIVAKTLKGKDFPGIEDQENWHGKPLGAETENVLNYLRSILQVGCGDFKYTIPPPSCAVPSVDISNITLDSPPEYNPDDKVATRTAYGKALTKLVKNNPRVIALDGDTKNSTFSDEVKKFNPDNHIECYIAEQNMVGVAIGLACRDRCVAFVSTFAAFLTRAFDQIRMGAISMTNINLCGSHVGTSIGEDGPSQMALEDLAMFRAIATCTVFYPADAVACERAVELAANTQGITFIRTGRPTTPIIYPMDQTFAIGKANVVYTGENDQCLVIGGGVTLTEAIAAAKKLAEEGISIRVLDLFTIKPIDKDGIIQNAKDVGSKIIVVEDHFPEGGIGEAVLSAIAQERDIYLKHVAVPRVPRSGKAAELFDLFGLDANHIVEYVKEIIQI